MKHDFVDGRPELDHKYVKEMIVVLIEDLSVVKSILESGKGTLPKYDLSLIYTAREWDVLCEICPQIPNYSDIYEWVSDDSGDFLQDFKVDLTCDLVAEHIGIAIANLKTIYNDKSYEKKSVGDMIIGAYNSQWFCQISQPLLMNPQLDLEFRKEFKRLGKLRVIKPNKKRFPDKM